MDIITAIEDGLATAIYDFAGETGTSIDSNLTNAQLIKKAVGGTELVVSDRGAGPLVRVQYLSDNLFPSDGSFGAGDDGRFWVSTATVRVYGVTAINADVRQARQDRNNLAKVITYRLTRLYSGDNGATISQSMNNGELDYLAQIDYLAGKYYLDAGKSQTPGQNDYVGIFTLDFTIKVGESTGPNP